MTIDQLNHTDATRFVEFLAGVYELSPWVAAAAEPARPFSDRDSLIARMREVVEKSSGHRKLELLGSHPDLAGKLAASEQLSPESDREQSGLGLDRLPARDFSELSDLNCRYREKFGIPFIICVRHLKGIPELLSVFRRRIENNESEERSTALSEVHAIAELRLKDLVE